MTDQQPAHPPNPLPIGTFNSSSSRIQPYGTPLLSLPAQSPLETLSVPGSAATGTLSVPVAPRGALSVPSSVITVTSRPSSVTTGISRQGSVTGSTTTETDSVQVARGALSETDSVITVTSRPSSTITELPSITSPSAQPSITSPPAQPSIISPPLPPPAQSPLESLDTQSVTEGGTNIQPDLSRLLFKLSEPIDSTSTSRIIKKEDLNKLIEQTYKQYPGYSIWIL